VVEELLGYNAREGGQLSISGPPLRLQPRAAELFALAIHELATNALKYGSLSTPSGRVDVSWRIESDTVPEQLIFEWNESKGPSVGPQQRRGFGTELLERTMAFELKGETTLRFDSAGLRCMIVIPASRRLLHAPVGRQ
jgi:two-component system CheB/CheR fusion protein